MEASIVDLRYKMKDVLKALEKNEKITIFYHGKEKGQIIPTARTTSVKASQHPFFGSAKKGPSVESIMNNLRKNRYDI